MRYLLTTLVLGILFLAACEDDDVEVPTRVPTSTPVVDTESTDNAEGNFPPPNANQEFTATLSGGIEATLIGDGAFSCLEALDMITVGLYGVDPDEGGYNTRIDLNLPIDLTPQTYTVGTREDGTGEGSAWAALNVDNDVYDSVAGGTIEVAALPSGEGEPVQGSFDFTVSDADGTTISIVGSVDFIPSPTSTVYCE